MLVLSAAALIRVWLPGSDAIKMLSGAALDPVSASAPYAAAHPMLTTTITNPVCPDPTPTSADGYQAMFRALPTDMWGAADVSISTRVGVYNVWLFGDTISGVTSWSPFAGRFVRSTVVTQRYGCLHVSHGGAQLLPNDPDGTWYWIKAAAPVDSTHLRVTADHVQRTGDTAWSFKVIGERTATAVLDSSGDATFEAWAGTPVPVQNIVRKDGGIYAPWTSTVSEVSNGKVLVTGLPHSTSNFSYAPSVHPETRMASGRVLLTVCQNASPLTGYDLYRPLFFEVTL